jgi:hypothetical protein
VSRGGSRAPRPFTASAPKRLYKRLYRDPLLFGIPAQGGLLYEAVCKGCEFCFGERYLISYPDSAVSAISTLKSVAPSGGEKKKMVKGRFCWEGTGRACPAPMKPKDDLRDS